MTPEQEALSRIYRDARMPMNAAWKRVDDAWQESTQGTAEGVAALKEANAAGEDATNAWNDFVRSLDQT